MDTPGRAEGDAGLHNHPSRPHTTQHGSLPASTVHHILLRHGLNRLAWLDRPTGEPVRRYERNGPGERVHLDVKKLGNIPDAGGRRTVGRTDGDRNRQATTDQRKSTKPVIGYSYIHSVVDDHSRLAYS